MDLLFPLLTLPKLMDLYIVSSSLKPGWEEPALLRRRGWLCIYLDILSGA